MDISPDISRCYSHCIFGINSVFGPHTPAKAAAFPLVSIVQDDRARYEKEASIKLCGEKAGQYGAPKSAEPLAADFRLERKSHAHAKWYIDSLTWWSHQYTSTIPSSNHNCVSCAGVISATFQASLCQFNLGGKCPWLSPKLRRSGGNNSCLKCLGHCGSSCLYRSPSVNQENSLQKDWIAWFFTSFWLWYILATSVAIQVRSRGLFHLEGFSTLYEMIMIQADEHIFFLAQAVFTERLATTWPGTMTYQPIQPSLQPPM